MKMDEVLSSETKEVFLYLAKPPDMSSLCLIAGSALALQVWHKRTLIYRSPTRKPRS